MKLINQNTVIGATLFMTTLLSRIPFTSRTLYNWDSVNFALALERYNLADQQPHPPGYILYIMTGSLGKVFLDDANNVLIALSAAGGAAAVMGAFFIGKSMFDRSTGIVAAVLLFFSPLAWHYSEVALSYTIELPLVLVAMWLLYQLFFYGRHAVAAAIVIGLAAGFRQDVLLFLGPFLFIGSLRINRRAMLFTWLALVVSVATWMIPLVFLAGGFLDYRTFNLITTKSLYGTSIFVLGVDSLINNSRQVFPALIWLFGFASIIWLYFIALLLSRSFWRERRLVFLLSLLLLPFAFFLLVHFGQPGYLVAYAGPLVLLYARTLILCADKAGVFWRKIRKAENGGLTLLSSSSLLAVFLIIVSITNSVLYLKGSSINLKVPFIDKTIAALYWHFNFEGVRDNDRQLIAAKKSISQFEPQNTLVVTIFPYDSFYAAWRRLMYYMPEYQVVMLVCTPRPGIYFEAQNHAASRLFYRQHRMHEWLSDNYYIKVREEIERVVIVGVDPDAMPQDLLPVTGNTTPVPINYVNMPRDGKLQVGAYEIER